MDGETDLQQTMMPDLVSESDDSEDEDDEDEDGAAGAAAAETPMVSPPAAKEKKKTTKPGVADLPRPAVGTKMLCVAADMENSLSCAVRAADHRFGGAVLRVRVCQRRPAGVRGGHGRGLGGGG